MQRKELPKQIEKHLEYMTVEQLKIGHSGDEVFKFYSDSTTYYLKMGNSGSLKNEVERLQWLQGKLPVPAIVEWYTNEEFDYLLMTEVKGKMLCDEYYLKNPVIAVSALADGLKLFHSIDLKGCTIQEDLQKKLEEATENVKNNLVDVSNWERNTKFSTPEELLHYLMENRPDKEDLVFCHGDNCLPNIIGNSDQVSGFIDVGRAGIADKWQDIALCIRSLRHNFKTEAYDSLLLEKLGISLNQEKLDYYILLDELF